MFAPESEQARRAALLLHGLPSETRSRVLARLSAGEAARLQPLLRELSELGVSPTLCRAAQERIPAVVRLSAPAGETARQRAETLDAADVAHVLKVCSPATMAAVLRIAAWSWQDEVLERVGELRRAQLQGQLRGDAPAPAPAVAEALCERLCREVGARGSNPWTR